MSMNSFHARAARPRKPAVRPVAPPAGVRADALLVQQGWVASRTLAQRLIEAGRVYCDGELLSKPARFLPATAVLSVLPAEESDYVSRGGLKLAAALRHTGLDVAGRHCLDLGQSTGGFTDCLLQAGAASVLGVDVGHGQLHAKLRGDARVIFLEGVNARELPKSVSPARRYDLIVADLSFISLTLVLPQLPAYLAPQGSMLLLVKPQFELGPQQLGKNGVVRDAALYAQVEAKLREAAGQLGFQVVDYFPSAILGGGVGNSAGNREFFIWIKQHES